MQQYAIYKRDKLIDTLIKNGYELVKLNETGHQLGSMQAWVLTGLVLDLHDGVTKHVEILQSYNTLVAYKIDGVVTRCGWWSKTTSIQITKWER